MSHGIIWSMLELTDDKKYYGEAGTETNPYGIEDVFDFCSIKNDADKEQTYYQLVNNIDFNDHPIYRNGIKVNDFISGTKCCLNGDGKAIRNIVFYGTTVTDRASMVIKEIKNCRFENMVNAYTTINTYQCIFYTSLFENCSFYILFQNSNFKDIAGYSTPVKFKSCTFNFDGLLNAALFLGNKTFERCHINFKNTTMHSSPIDWGTYSALMLRANLDHTYMTGKLNVQDVCPGGLHIATAGSMEDSVFSNFYYCVETTLDKPDVKFGILATANNTSFYSKDLIQGEREFMSGTNFYALSDEECKNPSKLASIGFPVIGE